MTQEQEVMIRLECLKMAHSAADPDTLVTAIINIAHDYYNFLKGELPNE